MRLRYLSLLLVLFLSACASPEVESVVEVERPLPTSTPTTPAMPTPLPLTLAPSATSTQTATSSPTATPSPTNTPLPTSPAITRTAGIPPVGLIFHTADGLWRTNEGGEIEQLSDHPNAMLSPMGQQILYVQNDDIWLTDLATGATENLTQTPNRYECCPRWWPTKDNAFVFGSWPDTYDRHHSDFGDFQFGFLTVWDDGVYQVLDETEPFYNSLAPRPGSDMVVYGGYLYDQEPSGTLGERNYIGLPENTTIQSISHATWSPDARLLAAYIVYRVQNSSPQ